MRAVQMKRAGELIMTDVPKPKVAAGQVLLKVTAAGVCQTDVHIRRSPKQMVPDGLILGHEIAGRIVEMADDVRQFAIGDDVIVHPVWAAAYAACAWWARKTPAAIPAIASCRRRHRASRWMAAWRSMSPCPIRP